MAALKKFVARLGLRLLVGASTSVFRKFVATADGLGLERLREGEPLFRDAPPEVQELVSHCSQR